jgi:hypothetical protein
LCLCGKRPSGIRNRAAEIFSGLQHSLTYKIMVIITSIWMILQKRILYNHEVKNA